MDMPELPEVETVARGLSQILSPSCKVVAVELRCGDLRTKVTQEHFSSLMGDKLVRIHRRAKYLLFEFRDHVLINHLGMTGSWREWTAAESRKHDHCVLKFSSGESIVFNDPRRFGVLILVKRGEELEHPTLRALGPEPLTSDFSGESVFARTRKRSASIKAWIMDQRNVVGVGNIYACEALFRAKVRPARRAEKVTLPEANAIVKAIKTVLTAAIEKGGTTFRDFKQAGDTPGHYQDRLLVYDRKGESCRKCKEPIRTQVLAGRSTFWCPSCQR